MALLRSVGHVLEKVDGASNAKLGNAVATAWRELNTSKPEPLIFWKFIEEERNNVLKAYRTAAKQHVVVQPPTTHVNLATGEETESGGGPTLYLHVMADGPFSGQDPMDLVETAITWWQEYLNRIDSLAAVT